MFRWIRSAGAVIGLGGLLLAGCGSGATPPAAPAPGNRGQFVVCPGSANGSPSYAILDSPGPGCRALLAGQDYADGRVIIGLRQGASDSQLASALAAYRATVVSSQPELGDRVLAVPKGTVPEAVVGLGRYSFIAFAAPDLLAHTNMAN